METATDAREPLAAIVNPAAGHGRANRRWRRVEAQLAERGIMVATICTAHRGHATDLTRQAIASGFRTILAVGGDGTVHEVVNGFRYNGTIHQDVRLGVIPAGTGMDFARNAGFGHSLGLSVDRVLRGTARRMDVGLSGAGGGRLFVNFAESGIGAAVVAREGRFHRRMPGRMSFFFAALEALRTQSNTPCQITVDGELAYSGPLVSVVVANGRSFGGGMRVAPQASMDDGMLDVVVLGDFSRGELVAQVWKIYPGVHLRHSKVAWVRGRAVEVTPLAPVQLDLDGELYDDAPSDFTVLPGALQLLA